VVLDGPASGQLMALLEAPGTFRRIARAGPVARQTADIERLLGDHHLTGVIGVTTPEQTAVSELLELQADLERLGIMLDAVVINKTVAWPLARAQDRLFGESVDDPALRSAHWFSDRVRDQRRQIERLRRGVGNSSQTTLPLVFAGIDRVALDRLAEGLRRGVA